MCNQTELTSFVVPKKSTDSQESGVKSAEIKESADTDDGEFADSWELVSQFLGMPKS